MSEPVVVFLGHFDDEHIPWGDVAHHEGWKVRRVSKLNELTEVQEHAEVPAVFVECCTGDCLAEKVAKVRSLAPKARIVACYPLSAPMLADELVAAGAFHSIPRPLNAGEVKQSLGFVWEAWSRKPRRVDSMRSATAASAA